MYTVIELFAGAGGLALGLENAGFSTQALIEIDPIAVATLKRNRPKWPIINQDVSMISFEKGICDIVAGGFPCQAFSFAGKQLGFNDTRGTLFFEFARIVEEVMPKIFVAENVRGLVKHNNGQTLDTIITILCSIGYSVEWKILNAQYFDVAQKRERLIIIGTRKDLNIPIQFPKEKDYILTLRDVLKNVPCSRGHTYSTYKKEIMEQIPEGGYWRDLPENLQRDYMGASYYRKGGKTGIARRLSFDKPSLTLTCDPGQKYTERCHPHETRPLTIREYARIQSFPDEWEFEGSITNQYKQIGNAVPVNMAYHIGLSLKEMLDSHEQNNIRTTLEQH